MGHTAGTQGPHGSRSRSPRAVERGQWGESWGLVLACWEDRPALGHAGLKAGLPCGPAPAPASPNEEPRAEFPPAPPHPPEAALCEQVKMLGGPRAQDLLRTVLGRRARVKELAESRGHTLHASLLMTAFIRAAIQVRGPLQPSTFHLGHICQFTDDVHLHGLVQASPQPCDEHAKVWRVKWLSQRPCWSTDI